MDFKGKCSRSGQEGTNQDVCWMLVTASHHWQNLNNREVIFTSGITKGTDRIQPLSLELKATELINYCNGKEQYDTGMGRWSNVLYLHHLHRSEHWHYYSHQEVLNLNLNLAVWTPPILNFHLIQPILQDWGPQKQNHTIG